MTATPNTSVHPTVAVIGGTGHTGRRVAEQADRCRLERLVFLSALGVVFEQIFDGRNAYTTDTVDRVLGRPAGDFAAYVRRAAASGAWSLENSPAEMAS